MPPVTGQGASAFGRASVPHVRAYIAGGSAIDIGPSVDLDTEGAQTSVFFGRDAGGGALDLSCVWPLVRTMRSAVLTHEEQHQRPTTRLHQVRYLDQFEGVCSAGRTEQRATTAGHLGYWLHATEDGRNFYFAVYVTEQVVGLMGMVVGRLAAGDEARERGELNRLLHEGARQPNSPFRRTIAMLLAKIGPSHPADPVLHSMLADIGTEAGVGRMLPIGGGDESSDEEEAPVGRPAAHGAREQQRYHPYAAGGARRFASPVRRPAY